MKVLVCGASHVGLPCFMFSFFICFISFIYLFLSTFIIFIRVLFCVLNDLIYFIELDIITLNSSRTVITFLFD
jgi:NADH-ubiquinone oxidoreductase chain 5